MARIEQVNPHQVSPQSDKLIRLARTLRGNLPEPGEKKRGAIDFSRLALPLSGIAESKSQRPGHRSQTRFRTLQVSPRWTEFLSKKCPCCKKKIQEINSEFRNSLRQSADSKIVAADVRRLRSAAFVEVGLLTPAATSPRRSSIHPRFGQRRYLCQHLARVQQVGC